VHKTRISGAEVRADSVIGDEVVSVPPEIAKLIRLHDRADSG
jgi:hypothetical protein